MTDFNFEKFKNLNARLENRISVTKSFSIGFPTKFYNSNGLRDFKYVVLFYDKERKAIGIQFTNNENETDKFSISHSKQGYGGHIVARSFFTTYDINPGKYVSKYEWEKSAVEGVGDLFVISLKDKEPKIKEGDENG